jgi:ABC-type Mn2+/Zn2+ transport system ATPase subunit
MTLERPSEPSAAAPPPLVRLDGVSVGYKGSVVLRDVSLAIRRGECVALLGANGSGKTTLFKTIIGILAPLSGTIRRAAPDLRLGYVPQRERLEASFPITVAEVVRMGGYRRLRPFLPLAEATRDSVAAALGRVGSAGWEKRLFGELSGGERQRVLIARALVSRPDLLLLDEPTTGVDLTTEQAIVDLVKELLAAGLSIVMVSHNLATVERVASRVVWVHRGELQSGPPTEMLTAEWVRRMLIPPETGGR